MTRRIRTRCDSLSAIVSLFVAGAAACASDNIADGSNAGSTASVAEPAIGAGSGGFGAGTGGTASVPTATGGAGAIGTGGAAGASGAGGSAGSIADAGSAGQPSAADGGSNAQCADADGATEHFSFFVTSLAGLRLLSGSQDGFGGDLRFGKQDGLSGADEICRQLAEASSAGAGCKTWRAFLSVTQGLDGNPVNARDRIGEGPWYDRLGRLVAMTKNDLLQMWPVGADPAIMYDLPNEDGVPNHNPDGTGVVDNHNTITGTNPQGMLYSPDWAFTCHDWTSSVGTDGTPMIGFSWRGGAATFPGMGWFFSSGVTEGGCAPIINLLDSMDFSVRGIGARGGYGGFYCLALEP